MIDVELRFRNYRCFGDEPVSIRIADGFTALVGTNNSGKSSLLRAPYELRSLFNSLTPPNNGILRGGRTSGLWVPTVSSGERVFRAGVDRPIEIEIIVRDGPAGQFLLNGKQAVLSIAYDRHGVTISQIGTEDGTILGALEAPLRLEIVAAAELEPFTRTMQVLAQAMYVGPFRNAINVGGQGSYYDIQTGDGFIRTFAGYKSGPSPEQNEAVYELLQEIKRIFGFENLDINVADEYKILQLTVDGRSYRLSEQGAGLAHFIVVLVNVLIRRPSFLLIDEPELNLHASLQLDFLQTLARYTNNGVIFATHSLGLARTAADTIYTLTKPAGGASRIRAYGSDRQLITLLGQLSFDRRPDLGFSKVLLVEGKSELRTLAQFLRFYNKEHEVLMLPLHGDEMIRGDVQNELSELLRIGGDVHYLIDSERSAAGESLTRNRQGFVDLCTELGIDGHVLERRALENYLTDAAVKRAFGDSVSALDPYEKKGWPKVNNWRIALEMTKADLDETDLGQFLDRL